MTTTLILNPQENTAYRVLKSVLPDELEPVTRSGHWALLAILGDGERYLLGEVATSSACMPVYQPEAQQVAS